MNEIERFAEQIKAEIKSFLPEKYQGVSCEIVTMPKNNGTKKIGILFRREGDKAAPVLYAEDFLRRKEEGFSIKEIMCQMAEMVKYVFEKQRKNEWKLPKTFEEVKSSLMLQLINTKANRRMLNEIPHEEIADLSLICGLQVADLSEAGKGILKISNEVLQTWGINKEELFEAAKENSAKLKPPVFECIYKERAFDLGDGVIKSFEKDGVIPEHVLYVLTNEDRLYGAAAMMYPEVMQKVSTLFPEGYYILPSSVHEVLIIPKSRFFQPKQLGEMVRDINQSDVLREERLSDRVYEFDKEKNKIFAVPESIKQERALGR